MEKNITGFYQALEKASRITGSRDSEGPGDFKLKCQVWDEYEFTEQAFFLMNVRVSSCHGTCASNGQSVSWFYFRFFFFFFSFFLCTRINVAEETWVLPK